MAALLAADSDNSRLQSIEHRLIGIEAALLRIEEHLFPQRPAAPRLTALTAQLKESQARRAFGLEDGEIVRIFELPTAGGGHETYFDLYEVAQQLRVSYEAVRRWVSTGELPARKHGRRRIVSRGDLARFLEAREEGT